jgi:ketosteroid isomerase-like protein
MDDDVQVVLELFARWNGGDHSVDPELVDPDVEVYSALAQQTFRGYDGGEAWIREIDEQFDDWRVEVGSSRPLGGGRFLLEGAIHGRGRQSGVDLDQPASWLVEVRAGRLLRLRNYIGREAAADALEGESGSPARER